METKLEQIAAKAVKQRPKSGMREIRTPRSVGTGGGRPPPVTRWAPSNGCPYRNRQIKQLFRGFARDGTDRASRGGLIRAFAGPRQSDRFAGHLALGHLEAGDAAAAYCFFKEGFAPDVHSGHRARVAVRASTAIFR